jgi:hypothetical protein
MGHNAGGFGSIVFPSRAALDAWQRSTIRYDDHDDWVGPLASRDGRPDEPVDERLAYLAEQHDVSLHCIRIVSVDERSVELVFDDGEDGFRDDAGDVAATFRGAASFGAVGTFWFLGTAGAEGELAFELALDGATSRLRALQRAEVDALYDGPLHPAFLEKVARAVDARLPSTPRVASPPKRAPAMTPASESPVAAIDRLLGASWKASVGRQWREIETHLGEIEQTRPSEGIAALTRWLEHPDVDVSGTAADVLLHDDDPEALDTLARRIHTATGPYALKRVIWATFKRDPAHALDALAFLFESVRSDPARADPRAVLVMWALRQSLTRFERPTFEQRAGVPLDLPKLDTRWLDLCHELAEVTAPDLALEPAAVLHLAGDPRAADALVRAVRSVGAAAVERAVRNLRIDVSEALRAASRDPTRADHAADLQRLARALSA